MSGVNPVILIQMLMRYSNMEDESDKRIFVFNRNNRIRVHKETLDESNRRKSRLSRKTVFRAKFEILNLLRKSLHGRIRKVWIDPKMKKIAVPLEMTTGETGYGVLPSGSRMTIPEGKFVRAFTYWEKVNDIDLSCFALKENGEKEEFSWRTMWQKQSEMLTYSGDQTSGYEGGSEYFDINIDLFRNSHPEYRYLVFCNNVYSGIDFNECECKAGFMTRDELQTEKWKGEREERGPFGTAASQGKIFDPKTVQTSFRINADSTFVYLFAIDLEKREMVWLNMANKEDVRVAGTTELDFMKKYLTITDAFNMGLLYAYASEHIVSDPEDADVLVGDDIPAETEKAVLLKGGEVVHSWDFEKMLRLLQPSS